MAKMFAQIDKSWTLFLDRDGVINKRLPGDYVKRVEDFEFLPGTIEALAGLAAIFGKIIVVTNQQGIGKGLMQEADLQNIHDFLKHTIMIAGGRIDAIYHCPDLAEKPNSCRKPSTEMADKAKIDFPSINFKKSVMIGDSLSDMQFGKNCGMHNVLIDGKKEENIHEKLYNYYAESLLEFYKKLKEI